MLSHDALRIWQAGLRAVDARTLVAEHLTVEGTVLWAGEHAFDLRSIGRLVVVGAGKAGAAMAEAVERQLGPRLLAEKQVTGWINVPEGCTAEVSHIHLHPARPPGVNEPTAKAVEGAEQILRLVGQLAPNDLCLCLISGGGSALLPAPIPGLTWQDKLAVTQHLSAQGANIAQLNTVRSALSRVKGGGLARHCRAQQMLTLMISDVPGDPLDVIASGPTVPSRATAADALAVLNQFEFPLSDTRDRIFSTLQAPRPAARPIECQVTHLVIGNNAMAVDGAGMEAERLGYSHAMICATGPEGTAEEVGRHLAAMAIRMRDHSGPNCLISGGEPTVHLVDPSRRGHGGRNQQLVLAAAIALGDARDVALLSGGTDGEDGPTDAAGAWIDEAILAKARKLKLNASDHLARNDAYRFFEPLGSLIKTGPTHTNVCDLRIVTRFRV